jgi:hypothetical protein
MKKKLKSTVTSYLFFLLFVLFLTPGVEFTYGSTIDAEVYIYAYGGTAITYDTVSHTTSGLSDSASVTGTFGDFAEGAYFVDLATASLGVYAYAYSDFDVGSQAGGGTSEIITSFNETLTFTIAPGDYTNDLTVTLDGHLDGLIASYAENDKYYPTAYQTWSFQMGNDTYNNGAEPCTHSIDTDFFLTSTILAAGNYTTERSVELSVAASLHSVAGAPTQEGTEAWAEVDFYNTGRFYGMNVPDGVTWTSESGVFLSDASYPGTIPVPEPATIFLVLLGAGFIGLAEFKKQWTKQ